METSEHSQSQKKTCEKHVLQDDWPVKSVMGLNLKNKINYMMILFLKVLISLVQYF